MRIKVKGLTEQISFRIDDADAEYAAAEAKKFGLSPHALARRIFLEWLHDTERDEVREALHELREAIIQQRADLKEAAIAILCDAGRLEVDQARRWVESRLFQ
jgi:hypothetical protein